MTLRYIDGSPVEPEYAIAVAALVEAVCDIEDLIPAWELESYIREQQKGPPSDQ